MEEQVKKKRVRKKTCEIDSIEKLKSNSKETTKESTKESTKEIPKTKELPKPRISKEQTKEQTKDLPKESELNQSQISFGKFNITVKKTNAMTPEELRNYYDKKFKIEDSEKTAKLMIQDDNNVIYEPMKEDEIYVKEPIKSLETKQVTKAERTNSHKILLKFSQGIRDKWPETTDILCWWCCHSFETMPFPCPVEYDEIRERYKVNGIFCSWSCVAAYSVKEYSSLSLVYQMRKDMGNEEEDIIISPPKQCLKSFGGYMNIKDYRALDKSKTLLISTEGLSYINQEIYEIRN